jgi:hypothetical protein
MANDSYTQQALAADPTFQTRMRSIVSLVGWQIMSEAASVQYHDEREAYARRVLNQVEVYARQFAVWITARPAVLGKPTSYNFPAGAVVTEATDNEIAAQLNADWNDIAGIPAPVVPAPPGMFTAALPRTDPPAPSAPPTKKGHA